ncbi:MAG: hypothetical protein H0U45_07980 [Tatlockia sp.]|jgi:hypothetical protein|nr:hypothetical protein [Tatlockia sp.]
MSNNILNEPNEPPNEIIGEPQDAQVDIAIDQTEDFDSPAQDVGSPTEAENSPTVDLDEL